MARGILPLRHVGFSLVAVQGLNCPVTCGILVAQPGIEPVAPALEGGFLTTGPPGKSLLSRFLICILYSMLGPRKQTSL